MLHTKDRQHANRDTALVLLIQTVDNIALKKHLQIHKTKNHLKKFTNCEDFQHSELRFGMLLPNSIQTVVRISPIGWAHGR